MSNRVIRVVIDSTEARRGAQQVNNALSSVGRSARQVSTQLNGVNVGFGNLGTSAGGAARYTQQASQAMAAANNNARNAGASINGLGGAFDRMRGFATAAGAAIAALGIGALVSEAVAATRAYQSLMGQLKTSTGSIDSASAAYARLQKFAATTPFSLNQSVEAFVRLKNLGLDPSERAMRSFGNTASAMGKDMMQVVEAVADASTGEFERLKELGIRASKQGDQISFTFRGMTTTVANTSAAITGYLTTLGENNFGSAMADQAMTLNGAISNLGDTWNSVLVEFGKGFGGELQSAIMGLSNGLSTMGETARSAGEYVGRALGGIVTAAKFCVDNIHLLTAAFAGLSAMLITRFAVVAVGAAVNGMRLLAAQAAMTASMTGVGLARAGAGAAASMIGLRVAAGGVAAMFGGPLGIAVGVLTVGYLLLSNRTREQTAAQQANAVAASMMAEASANATTVIDQLAVAQGAARREALAAARAALEVARARAAQARNTVAALVAERALAAGRASDAIRAASRSTRGAGGGIDPVITQQSRNNTNAKQLQEDLWEAVRLQGEANKLVYSLERALSAPAPAMSVGSVGAGANPGASGAAGGPPPVDKWAEYIRQLKEAREEAGQFGIAQKILNALHQAEAAIQDENRKGRELLTQARADEVAQIIRETEAKKRLAAVDATILANEQREWARQMNPQPAGGYVDGQIVVTGSRSAPNGRSLEDMEIDNEIFAERAKFIEDAVDHQEAMNLLASEEWRTREGTLRTQIAQRREQEKQRDAIMAIKRNLAGPDVFERANQYNPKTAAEIRGRTGGLAGAIANDTRQIDEELDRARAALEVMSASELATAEERLMIERDIRDLDRDRARIAAETTRRWSREFYNDMMDSISSVASGFEELFGEKIGRLVDSVGSALAAAISGNNPENNGVSKILGGIQKGLEKGIELNPDGKLNELFGANGTLIKGLGAKLQAAGMGAAIGSGVNSVMKAIGWNKFSKTGSQVGGAIGGAFGGPLGALAGSFIGGTVGSFFKKTPKASANIEYDALTGQLAGVKATGSKKYIGAATEMGNAVAQGINDLARRLGGTITGAPSVSVGIRNGKYVVDPTGKGQTSTKKGAVSFGKDGAEAAIAFAIRDAIKDGIITGLSPFAERVIRSASNLDSAIALAEGYEAILKELAAMENPTKAALDELTKNLDKMVKSMMAAGATSEELGKVEEYKRKKIEEVLKDSLSTLNDFRKSLFGEGSGVTALNRLNSKMSEFASMEAAIKSGKAIDQDAFTSLGQEIFGLARDVYGTATGAFQSIRQQLISATDGALANATISYDATTAAIRQQTDAITQNQVIQTDLLIQQNELLRAMINPNGGYAGDDYRAINGSLNVRLV